MNDFNRSPEYDKYINSPQWKRLREYAIKKAGGVCQICGISKYSVCLEVHHKTYERFKHERLSDLLVVCPDCHEKVDNIRREKVQRDNRRKLYNARLDGWASKVYGDDWKSYQDVEEVAYRFDKWLEEYSG